MKRVKREDETKKHVFPPGHYHVKQQRFPRQHLERLMATGATDVMSLEDQRCDSDLMYRLFRRPASVMPRLLTGLLALIARKNEPDLEQSSMFRDAREFLLNHPRADNRVKLFFVLIIINRDEDAQQLFLRSGYGAENMWGTADDGRAHFQRFLRVLDESVNFVMGTPFTPGMRVAQVNVVNVVRGFVLEAEQLYLTC